MDFTDDEFRELINAVGQYSAGAHLRGEMVAALLCRQIQDKLVAEAMVRWPDFAEAMNEETNEGEDRLRPGLGEPPCP